MLTLSEFSNLKYLVAFLNSRISEWYFDKITTTSGVGTNRWKKVYIENLPIPIPSASIEEKITDCINQILVRNKDQQSIKDIEIEIDALLLEMYNLNQIEIDIIYKVLNPSK